MRVLVTGASGLIGSGVCDALLARGDAVVGLSRNPDSSRRLNPTVVWHAWDATSEQPPPEALEGVDAVVNLVGEPINQRWTDEAKSRILASRVDATNNLVAAIAAASKPPSVLVSGSAVGYYGDRGSEPVSESAGPAATFDAEVCVAWEAAAQKVEGSGVRLVIVRTGLVLDPAGGLLEELMLPFKLGLGGPVAGGEQYMAWIHIDDEIRAILWAIDNTSAHGVYNLTAPNPATSKTFARELGRALHRPAVLPIPKLALKVRFGSEFGGVAAGGQRVMPTRLQEQGFEFRHPELGAALQELLARG